MADFDPDAYLKEKQAGAAFDPDAYLSEKVARGPAPEEPGIGKTLLHHGLGGFFKNWSDELGGQMERLDPRAQLPGAAARMPDGSTKFLESGDDTAQATTALLRDDLKTTADVHPGWAFAANMGGEILGDLLLKGVGVPVGSEPYAVVSGAVSGAGAADADTYGGKTGGAIIGAGAGAIGHDIGAHLVGPALGYVGRKVGGAITEAIPEAVREFAAKQALKASGYIQKDIKPLARRDPEKVIERGAELLREGNVRPFRTVDDVAEAAEASVERYGDAIGKVLKTADLTGSKFDLRPFLKRARQAILDPIKDDPAMAGEASKLAGLLEEYDKLPLGSVGFEKANQMKSNLQQQINWGNRWNDAKGVPHNDNLIKLQGIFLDEVDNQLGDAFSAMGQPGQQIRDAFKLIKSRYGIHADSLDKARMGMAREVGNDFVSGKDMMVGSGLGSAGAAASLMTGNPLMAAGSMALGGLASLGNKVLRERGASTAAVGANKLANVLEPMLGSGPMKWLAKVPADALEEYAGPLSAAATRGPTALAATVFALSQQNPHFREMKRQAEQGDLRAER